ncbi:MAG TPA: efflux RND transporter periplasmic adaptor subunit [Acidobacteriota bacterium]|nr:efflux RND transporter periplasmic adaptor subunit [Acidobacteriota bacterium]
MSRKMLTIAISIPLILGALWLWPNENQKSKPVPASAEHASYVAAEGRISVKPDHRAVLSAEVAGRIETILVDNLSPVHKGQVLAVIYNTDMDKRIRQTQASFQSAKADYMELANGSRVEDVQEAAANVRKAQADLELAQQNEARDHQLLEEGVIARSRYDATIAELKRAKSALEAAQQSYDRIHNGARRESIDAAQARMVSEQFAADSLKASYAKTEVRSPLDGIVILRYRNVSEFADVGDPILEVADLSQLIVDAEINETDAGRVHDGQKAIVTTDAFPGKEFAARVYEVSEALRKRTQDPDDPAVVVDQKILPVKVEFLQPVPLKLGMKVYLKIGG